MASPPCYSAPPGGWYEQNMLIYYKLLLWMSWTKSTERKPLQLLTLLLGPHANYMVRSPLRWDFYLKSFVFQGSVTVPLSTPVEQPALAPPSAERYDGSYCCFLENRIWATLNPAICVYSSCLSDAASGLSDGNEGSSTSGGRHEGRSMKRHQRRSVRSRSRHDKTTRAKLNVLSVCTYPYIFHQIRSLCSYLTVFT